jgi:hypothetical protein
MARSEMTSIVYVPLSTEEKQIRTLILCSGKINEPIRCALRIVSLEEQPAYEALSYTVRYAASSHLSGESIVCSMIQ